jgi:3-methyladenine DNA glycosylase AlkD
MTDSASQVAALLAEMKSKGTEKTRVTYARHGHPIEKTFGISTAEMKLFAKRIKGQQQLACELYDSGFLEAMYVAGMVAHGSRMTEAQLQAWADGADGMAMIAEYTVPWVTVEHVRGRELALQWIESRQESLAATGWRAYQGLVSTLPDENLDLDEIQRLLETIEAEIHSAPNGVRQPMNSFVIAVGIYVAPLSAKAKAAARRIGPVLVDVGDTACEVPLALAYIEKAEAAGRAGTKRKTIRC